MREGESLTGTSPRSFSLSSLRSSLRHGSTAIKTFSTGRPQRCPRLATDRNGTGVTSSPSRDGAETSAPSIAPMWSAPSWSQAPSGWLLCIWTYLLCVYPVRDTDLWWHLKTGEQILAKGAVPQVDWYTYTDFDKPWIDLHWGFQLVAYGLVQLGGLNLLILVKAAIYTMAVALAGRAGLVAVGRATEVRPPLDRTEDPRDDLPTGWRAAIWIPAVIGLSGRALERPEMFSLLFLATVLWILRIPNASLRDWHCCPRYFWCGSTCTRCSPWAWSCGCCLASIMCCAAYSPHGWDCGPCQQP